MTPPRALDEALRIAGSRSDDPRTQTYLEALQASLTRCGDADGADRARRALLAIDNRRQVGLFS